MGRVKVLIMGPLRDMADIDGDIYEEGGSIHAVVERLLLHDNIKRVFVDPASGQLQPYIRFFIRGNEVFDLKTPLNDGDELVIVPPVLGG